MTDRRGDRDPRDDRHRNDGDRNRENKRPRRDDDRRRGDSRDGRQSRAESDREREVCPAIPAIRRVMLNSQAPRPSTADAEEEAKKVRQAKVEAWKRKQLLKKGVDATASPTANTPGAASPAAASPSAETSSSQNGTHGEDSAPAKKFDHKAIAKRAAAAMEREKQKTALGGDVSIPKSSTHAPALDTSKLANNTKATQPNVGNGKSSPNYPSQESELTAGNVRSAKVVQIWQDQRFRSEHSHGKH